MPIHCFRSSISVFSSEYCKLLLALLIIFSDCDLLLINCKIFALSISYCIKWFFKIYCDSSHTAFLLIEGIFNSDEIIMISSSLISGLMSFNVMV